MVPLRHCCKCRSPTLVSHVDKIRAADGNSADTARATTAASLPLFKTQLCSQVADVTLIDVVDIRSRFEFATFNHILDSVSGSQKYLVEKPTKGIALTVLIKTATAAAYLVGKAIVC